ncbi:4-hydroxy-3-methylbut-2-en-1-yl diphosphate synthase, partial [Acrasis kona]
NEIKAMEYSDYDPLDPDFSIDENVDITKVVVDARMDPEKHMLSPSVMDNETLEEFEEQIERYGGVAEVKKFVASEQYYKPLLEGVLEVSEGFDHQDTHFATYKDIDNFDDDFEQLKLDPNDLRKREMIRDELVRSLEERNARIRKYLRGDVVNTHKIPKGDVQFKKELLKSNIETEMGQKFTTIATEDEVKEMRERKVRGDSFRRGRKEKFNKRPGQKGFNNRSRQGSNEEHEQSQTGEESAFDKFKPGSPKKFVRNESNQNKQPWNRRSSQDKGSRNDENY